MSLKWSVFKEKSTKQSFSKFAGEKEPPEVLELTNSFSRLKLEKEAGIGKAKILSTVKRIRRAEGAPKIYRVKRSFLLEQAKQFIMHSHEANAEMKCAGGCTIEFKELIIEPDYSKKSECMGPDDASVLKTNQGSEQTISDPVKVEIELMEE